MDYFLVLGVLFCVVIYVYIICCQVNSYFDLQREKAISQRGYLVHGKVDKVDCMYRTRGFSKPYNCTPIVFFSWEDKQYRLKSLTTIPRKKYQKGSAVELLYLPEYPKKVILKGEKLSSIVGFWIESFFILFGAVVLIYIVLYMI